MNTRLIVPHRRRMAQELLMLSYIAVLGLFCNCATSTYTPSSTQAPKRAESPTIVKESVEDSGPIELSEWVGEGRTKEGQAIGMILRIEVAERTGADTADVGMTITLQVPDPSLGSGAIPGAVISTHQIGCAARKIDSTKTALTSDSMNLEVYGDRMTGTLGKMEVSLRKKGRITNIGDILRSGRY